MTVGICGREKMKKKWKIESRKGKINKK